MKYYKDSSNNVFAYESDGSQDDFILPDLIKITENEAMLLANPPPDKDEIIRLADAEKSQRLAVAKDAIDPLADAVDFDEATDAEIEKLKEWKKYRLALTRIDTSMAPIVEWPQMPC